MGLGFAAALAIGQGSSTDRALFGRLSGQNEISDEGERGAGDRNARGSATAIVDGGQLCFGLTVKNTDTPQAAHIHRGGRDANGPVVVQLEAPEEDLRG